jgi:hypothetical protein
MTSTKMECHTELPILIGMVEVDTDIMKDFRDLENSLVFNRTKARLSDPKTVF